MTENEGATASFRFPSFFYNYSYSPYSASYAENRDDNLRMKVGVHICNAGIFTISVSVALPCTLSFIALQRSLVRF